MKEHNVIGCAKMCGFDIRTVICVGEENIFSVLKSTVLIFVVGLIIVLIVTVLVAFGLSYRFTRPVTRMIEKIQAFGKQDFDDRMEILRSRSIMTLESCSTRWLKGLNI